MSAGAVLPLLTCRWLPRHREQSYTYWGHVAPRRCTGSRRKAASSSSAVVQGSSGPSSPPPTSKTLGGVENTLFTCVGC